MINKSNYALMREPSDTHQQILDDEISTLPSPSMSNVGIDSDQDTTETEVLLSSYLKKVGGTVYINNAKFTHGPTGPGTRGPTKILKFRGP